MASTASVIHVCFSKMSIFCKAITDLSSQESVSEIEPWCLLKQNLDFAAVIRVAMLLPKKLHLSPMAVIAFGGKCNEYEAAYDLRRF